VVSFLFLILAGIIQGCPASGVLFAVASHPFFQELEIIQAKVNRGTVFGMCFTCCADDAGGALDSYKLLVLIAPVFRKAEMFVGLTLKPKKSIIVPTSFDNFEVTSNSIKEWLAVHLPGWADFGICSSSRYLGVVLGPKAGNLSWDAASAKFLLRTSLVSHAAERNGELRSKAPLSVCFALLKKRMLLVADS
jgi:hypothetical protein